MKPKCIPSWNFCSGIAILFIMSLQFQTQIIKEFMDDNVIVKELSRKLRKDLKYGS